MISNGPSRTFTREAVEAWLHRLSTCDWEKSIDQELLREAQSFYRKGLLSALDIQAEQVIITQKINREETYSVIEWNGGKPEIRTSLDDESMGSILGTAGLYEIEELIAEIQEEDPLLENLTGIKPSRKLKTFKLKILLKQKKRRKNHLPKFV